VYAQYATAKNTITTRPYIIYLLFPESEDDPDAELEDGAPPIMLVNPFIASLSILFDDLIVDAYILYIMYASIIYSI
jgi:hypothetical protein